MQKYSQQINPNYPDHSPAQDLKDQLNLLVANQANYSGKTYVDQLNQILNKALANIGTKDYSLSIADLCFLPIDENHKIASDREISLTQKLQLENILTQLINNDFSSVDENGIVRLEDGQEFILGKLLTTEKIDDKPFISFAVTSGDATNPDPSIASFEIQQSNFAQKLFEEIFNCNKTFAELTPDQQQIFREATAQATQDLISNASFYPQINSRSLQKISLMQLSNLAKQINETFEASFHQLLIKTNDPHCQDPDAFTLGYSQNYSLIDNFLIGRNQDDLVAGFWQNYFGDFLSSANIKKAGLSDPKSNSSVNDLLRLFQGALAVKLPANQITDQDKTCFVPTKDDLAEYVTKYLNLTKAKKDLPSQCVVEEDTPKTTPQTLTPSIPSTPSTPSNPKTTPPPTIPTKTDFSQRIAYATQVEALSALISEIIRFIALNSEKFKKIPKHHQQNIFWSIDTTTRFAVIAILANEDKLSTIASLSVASASSFSLKKITSMSYEKLKGYSNAVKQLGEKFSSIPQPGKAFIETGALVALYQGFNQLLFTEQEPDKSQSQQFSESMAIIAFASLGAGIARGLLRYLSNNILEKLNPRANQQPDQELGNVSDLIFRQRRTSPQSSTDQRFGNDSGLISEQRRTPPQPSISQSSSRRDFLTATEPSQSLAEPLLIPDSLKITPTRQ